MTAWLARAGAAPLALRPVFPGCVRPTHPQMRRHGGPQEGERRRADSTRPLESRLIWSCIYRCNSRIGQGTWVMARWVERSGIILEAVAKARGRLVVLPDGPRKA